MTVFDACAKAAFSACGSVSNVLANAFSSTKLCDDVAAGTLASDAGGHGGDESGRARSGDVCCAGGRGTLWVGAEGEVSGLKNSRMRSLFRIMVQSHES